MSDYIALLTRGSETESQTTFFPWDRSLSDPLSPGVQRVVFSHNGLHLEARLAETDGTIYRERAVSSEQGALCVCFGWCYTTEGAGRPLGCDEYNRLIAALRENRWSEIGHLSGIYSMLVVDPQTDRCWVLSDKWSMRGFFYGGNDQLVAVSSKSAAVAHCLARGIDGISLLALLRDTGIPPGRSLFDGVHRSTPGRALVMELANRSARLTSVHSLYRPPCRRTLATCAEKLAATFEKVVGLAAGMPSVAIDLTGGNDSRLTAAALSSSANRECGRRATYVVIEDDRYQDARVAQQIADTNGWKLCIYPRDFAYDKSLDHLGESAIRCDGMVLPLLPELRGFCRLGGQLGNFRGHLGSKGGELTRDFFWRHEFLNMGRTRHVNYEALLRYRFYAQRDVDLARITDNGISYEEHDRRIMEPFRAVDRQFSDVLNVYKLDLFYLYKLGWHTHSTWRWSPYQCMSFPYLTSEVTDVTLQAPWTYRLARRLSLRAIQLLNPAMSMIPSDVGAPMMPPSLCNMQRHWAYLAGEIWGRVINRRKRDLKTNKPYGWDSPEVPAEWIGVLKTSKASRCLPLLDLPQPTRSVQQLPSAAAYRELCAHLMLHYLFQQYPAIDARVNYDSPEAELFQDVTLAAPR